MYRPAAVTVVTGGNGAYRLAQHLLTGPAPDAHRATRMIEVPGIKFAKPAPVGERGAMHSSTPESVPVIELKPRRVGATFEVSLPPSSVMRFLLQPPRCRKMEIKQRCVPWPGSRTPSARDVGIVQTSLL